MTARIPRRAMGVQMQLHYETNLSAEDYVTNKAWLDATLEVCPNHPKSGCSLARHGTYGAQDPARMPDRRYYCSESHTTFSLLPEFLAAKMPGTLQEVEEG